MLSGDLIPPLVFNATTRCTPIICRPGFCVLSAWRYGAPMNYRSLLQFSLSVSWSPPNALSIVQTITHMHHADISAAYGPLYRASTHLHCCIYCLYLSTGLPCPVRALQVLPSRISAKRMSPFLVIFYGKCYPFPHLPLSLIYLRCYDDKKGHRTIKKILPGAKPFFSTE